MTILIYSFTLFLNMIFAFKKRHSKIVIAFTLVVILLLIGGAGPEYISFNHSRDYNNYKLSYDNINSVGFIDNPQIGYTFLMKVGSFINLDFFLFRLIVMAICLLLIYKLIIKRYSYNSNFILVMYMIYPMIIDSEHFRNFIAMTILLIAVRFLEDKTVKNAGMFILLIFLAASFHTVFFFYLVLVLVNTKNRNRLVKAIAVITVTLTVITILNNNEIPFLGYLVSLFEDDKIIGYLESRTNWGFIIPIVLHSSSILLLFWSKKIILRKQTQQVGIIKSKTNGTKCNNDSKLSLINLVFWINVVGVIFFPLFIMSLQFYRLVRNFLIINFIVYSLVSATLKKGSLYKFLFNFSVIASLVLWFILDLVIKTPAERVLIPFFTQNYFFN